jgi:hypothetical protein
MNVARVDASRLTRGPVRRESVPPPTESRTPINSGCSAIPSARALLRTETTPAALLHRSSSQAGLRWRPPQARHQLLVVVAQFGQHVERRNESGVVVEDALQAADLADRPQSHAPDFSNPLRDRIRGSEDLIALLIQEQVIVAKVRTRHVPMEILCLQVQCEHVREQQVERGGDLLHRLRLQVRRRMKRRDARGGCVFGNCHLNLRSGDRSLQ